MNVLSGDFYGGSRTPPGSVDSNRDWLDAAARTAFRSTGSDRLSPTPEPTSMKQAGPSAVAPSVITSPRASSRVAYLSLTKCSACPNAVLDPAQSLCEVSTFTPSAPALSSACFAPLHELTRICDYVVAEVPPAEKVGRYRKLVQYTVRDAVSTLECRYNRAR